MVHMRQNPLRRSRRSVSARQNAVLLCFGPRRREIEVGRDMRIPLSAVLRSGLTRPLPAAACDLSGSLRPCAQLRSLAS